MARGLFKKVGIVGDLWKKVVFKALVRAAHQLAKECKAANPAMSYRDCYRQAWQKIKAHLNETNLMRIKELAAAGNVDEIKNYVVSLAK